MKTTSGARLGRMAAITLMTVPVLVLTACFGGSPDDSLTTQLPPDTQLPSAADPLPIEDLAAFSGVAAMNAGSNCTGTLLDTKVPAGPAYVLTNGHCVGDVGRSAQRTTVGEPWSGTAEFLRAAGNEGATHTVEVVELAYSTMRHTDTAVVRLDATLGELEDLGIQPVPVRASEPDAGDKVVNVGVPVQGIDYEDWVLRRGECTLSAQHSLIEFGWLWFDVWSNDCPGIVQGSSGSPLFSVDGDGAPVEIVGMINTTSEGVSAADGGACFINRPCQVTESGVEMVERTSYAQSVAGLGACFDAGTGVFGLGAECPLPTSSIWSETAGGSFRGGDLANATGGLPSASFVGSEPGTFRTALVPLGDGTVCTDPATYRGVDTIALPIGGDAWELLGEMIDVTLPESEGHFAQCAVRGEEYAQAATVLFDVDRTPPLFSASAEVEDIGGGVVLVRPHLNPPEISTVRFTWGSPEKVSCADRDSFQDFFIVPLTLESSDLPARYCVYGMDSAGNATEVSSIDIPVP